MPRLLASERKVTCHSAGLYYLGTSGVGFFSLNAYPRGKWYHVACRNWSQTLSISLKVYYSHMRHSNIFCGICVQFKKQNFVRKQSYSVRDQNHEKINFKLKPVKKKQLHFGNFSATFWHLWGKKNNNFLANLDIFIGNFLRIYRQLVVKPTTTCVT